MPLKRASPPDIFEFLDVILYLETHLYWRKKQERGFSLAAWSEELNLGNKTLLRLILKRTRNITPRVMASMKASLKLNDAEATYFEHLIQYSQAKGEAQKQAFAASLLQLHRAHYRQCEILAPEAAQHVLGPVLLTLLTFTDIDAKSETLAILLQTTPQTVENILTDFEECGLVTRAADGTYATASTAIKVPNAFHSEKLRKFYEYWIGRSLNAIDLPAETRRFRVLQFALSEDEFQEAVERINDFALTLLTRFHNDSLSGRRLYMMENALFPISQKPQMNLEAIDGLTSQSPSPRAAE